MKNYDFIDNIFIRPAERTFGYSDGDAVEDYLLHRIMAAADVSTGSAELAAAIRDWPSLYHLSPQRADLLRPLSSLLQGKRILEIGCGCGALTRFLGELGCQVTALEGSKKRALITRERCRDQENVRVVCDNFNDFQCDDHFDIILLVGVLEYSHQFIKGNYPPLDMLRRAKEYLRPGGSLVLAIENQLGLKYWAGAPEDHTGRAFDGIENKYTTDTAVTFGKAALVRLLSGAGFPSREFLYPFPDYKLPEVIVKEEAFSAKDLRLQNLLHEKFDYPHGNGQATEFSATRAAGPVLENKLMADLANSFLVVARPGEVTAFVLPPDNTLVYTYNSVRKKFYCKSNLITRTAEGSLRVIRTRLYPQAPFPADEPITHHIRDENYIPGKLLSNYALDIVTREGWSLAALELWANRYYQVLLDHAAEEPGTLEGRYLDLTPFNILVTDEDRTMVFDQEWHCPDNVPLYFIFFRGLVYTLDKISMYATPAMNTPVDLIPLVTALINTFFPFGATQVEACIRLEEKYFQAIPLLPGQPFSHGRIHLKSLRKTQSEVQAQLEKTVRELAVFRLQSQQQVARIHQDHQAHIGLLHQQIDWYRRTYEQRSLAGVLLQRRLSSARAGQKYLTAFLLASAQEKGAGKTLSLILKTIFSKGWQGLRHPRKALMPLMRPPAAPPVNPSLMYGDQDPTRAAADIQAFTRRPKISFIMPVYNTDPRWLQKAVDSIRGQWYDNWELCIADDGSTHQGTRQLLSRLEDHSPDPRITIVRLANNAGISEASNAALELADGDYIALMDHDDEITPDALYQVVKDLQLHSDADILYTDECKVDEEGHLSDPFYKPAYSEELLLNMMYAGHLTLYKKDFLLKKVGRFRPAYDLSQDYDLMLRAVEQTTRIRHIEKVLYHWRMTAGSSSQGEKPHARITNLAALGDAMKRRNIPADIIELPAANRVKLRITDPKPLVSIIIPTDSRENLRDTLESIYTRTDYPHIEVVVVTNSALISSGLSPEAHSSQLAASLRHIPYDHPYNFSDKCNVGAKAARGEILIFFNDDVRPLQNDWVDNTIEYLFIPGVGGVSPKLIYEDDSIQYAGMASGVRGLTGTTFHGYPKDSTAYINFPQSVRNVSILSGACLAIKKDVFEAIGGFDSVNTPSSHSDVDLSFRLLDAGRRCVYTPYATLRHIGHLSLREYDRSPASRRKDKADIYLLRRWAQRLATDPYFTTAMRDHLYHDSPEPYRIYAPSSLTAQSSELTASRDILLVSHDLSLSGAPVMLLQLCRLLIRSGYFVTVICEKDGPMREMFLHEGAPVIIDSLLLQQHDTLSRFARNFDHVICNTVVTWPVVRQLSAEVHTIWWMHEAKLIGSFAQDPDFIETLAEARHIVAPSDYSLLYVREYNPHPVKIYYGYPDIAPHPSPRTANEKIIFSIFGSIEPRKGQDVLVRALQQLDPEMQDSIEIWLVGRPHDADYYQHLLFTIGSAGNIKIMGERDHRECLDLMRRSDVIVCPSRDDPFPVVIVEALCLSKPCIVTSHTGFFELITDGVDGFVIPNEDSEALASKMAYLMQHPQTLTPMGRAARQLYEQHLTMDGFTKKFLSLLGTEPQSTPARQVAAQKTMLCQD